LTFLLFIPIDDVEQNILITFELDSYGVQEGQPSVEVCAVTSATPDQGQSISAQISTEDGSATGKFKKKKMDDSSNLSF
jgi:hypothetical protein